LKPMDVTFPLGLVCLSGLTHVSGVGLTRFLGHFSS
jgi:hypothetical protein